MANSTEGRHLQPRTTKIYSNNSVYAPNGLLMFRCSDRKLEWYLRKDLAESISPYLYDPSHDGRSRSIRLLFAPKGTGRNRAGDEWYLEDQKDKCVVCGSEGTVMQNDEEDSLSCTSVGENARPVGLTLHHVIPYQYRKEMPLSFKSHGSHDVLAVCIDDHERYEQFATAEKLKLAAEYNAPLAGRGWVKHPGVSVVRAAAAALTRYRDRIPQGRIAELEQVLVDFYDLASRDNIQQNILEDAMSLKSLEKGVDFIEHGAIVIHAIQQARGNDAGLADFVRFWRQHFLDVMNPQHLSRNWSVDDPVNLTAGEYNPYRPEMDGV